MVREGIPEAGYSLIELLLVVVLFSVIAMIAIPRFDGTIIGRASAMAAAREVAADMRLCRTLALTNAGSNPLGYAIRMREENPCPGYTLVNRLTDETVSTKSFFRGITVSGHSEFVFGPLGNLLSGSGTSLVLSGGGKTCTLSLTAANGAVWIGE